MVILISSIWYFGRRIVNNYSENLEYFITNLLFAFINCTCSFLNVFFISLFLENTYPDVLSNQENFIIIVFTLAMLFVLISFLYPLAKAAFREAILLSSKEFQFVDKKWKLLFLILLLILFLIIPDFAFGSLYNFAIPLFSESIVIDEFQYFYLAFIIHFALPLNEEKFLGIVELINSNRFLSLIEMLHTYTTKIIDIVILATIAGIIINIIKPEEEEKDEEENEKPKSIERESS